MEVYEMENCDQPVEVKNLETDFPSFEVLEDCDDVQKGQATPSILLTPSIKRRKMQSPSPTKMGMNGTNPRLAYMNTDVFEQCLMQTEEYTTISPFMDHQEVITRGMRAVLVDWMSELCNNYSLHRVTYHLSVNLLDRFLYLDRGIQRNEFQTLGCVCVSIATKFCEPVSVNLDMLQKAAAYSCTKSQLIDMEHRVICKLEWHIYCGTLADWVLLYLQRLRELGCPVPYDMLFRCMDLCDRLLLDAEYCQFGIREIALSVVSAFCCECLTLQSYVKQLFLNDPLNEACVEWILNVGLTAPSHPLLQLLDSEDGEKTKMIILSKEDMSEEFNYTQSYNQLSLTHYSSQQK